MSASTTRVDFDIRTLPGGVEWFGGCLEVRPHKDADIIHGHVSTFLVRGSEKTLLVDTGHPNHWTQVKPALEAVLGEGQTLDYIFPTHQEMPHSGNVRRLIEMFPHAKIVGDVRDFHLYYPSLAAKGALVRKHVGDEIDLGDRKVVIVDALIRDLPGTQWCYDTGSRTLFVADGFGYGHHHEAGQCRLTSSEYPQRPDMKNLMFVNERALIWTRYVDSATYWPRIEELFEAYPPSLIAPAHGGVIDNPDEMIPYLKSGMDAIRGEETEIRQADPTAGVNRFMWTEEQR